MRKIRSQEQNHAEGDAPFEQFFYHLTSFSENLYLSSLSRIMHDPISLGKMGRDGFFVTRQFPGACPLSVKLFIFANNFNFVNNSGQVIHTKIGP